VPHRIEGDMVEEFLKEVNAKIDQDFKGNPRLKIMTSSPP